MVAANATAHPLLRLASSVLAFCRKALAIADLDLRKLRRDPTELVTRAIQPALWLLLFGEVMSRSRALATGTTPYLDFLVPGILAQSVLFIAIFNGISIIWERDLGIIHKFLASPTPRAALVIGKALGGGVRALTQAVVVLLLGLALGVRLRLDPAALAGVALLVVLGAAVFSTFSLIIACVVKTRERFMGIGQVLTMPLFFASNAIYPIALMPGWLQTIARLNPLTYEVAGLRTLLLPGFAAGEAAGVGLPVDVAVLVAALVALVALAARQYPKIVQ
jgi:ABC-2 type transport system permease protein